MKKIYNIAEIYHLPYSPYPFLCSMLYIALLYSIRGVLYLKSVI